MCLKNNCVNPSKLCREAYSNNLLNMVICVSNENARQIITHKLNFNLKYLNNVTSVIIILFPVLSTVDLNYTDPTIHHNFIPLFIKGTIYI